jgi:hypothetical protein
MSRTDADARTKANRARKFPLNTCPASRHVSIMAFGLWADGSYAMFADDPKHCAESMYSTLESLWEARTALQALRPEVIIPSETGWWWESPEGKKFLRAAKRRKSRADGR